MSLSLTNIFVLNIALEQSIFFIDHWIYQSGMYTFRILNLTGKELIETI